MKTAAAESSANAARIEGWITNWLAPASNAFEPLADFAFDGGGAALMLELTDQLRARVARLAIQV